MGKVGSRQDSEYKQYRTKIPSVSLVFLLYSFYMNWAERRKLTYALVVLLVIGGVSFMVIRNAVHVEATCADSKRNGSEVGVDCGGGCAKYCKNELAQPKIRWSRTFEITPGIVHAVASIEHSYPGAAARQVRYLFKIYDNKNTLITEREGSTYIGPMGQTAIVETIVPVGNVAPALTRLVFLEPVPWEKIASNFSSATIKTDRTLIERYDGGTRLTVTLENTSRYSFTNMDTVAILYDNNQNAITVSKILVPSLPAEGKQTVYFTWPFAINTEISRIEIIPRINPFTAKSL
jgi:hypothetical protein